MGKGRVVLAMSGGVDSSVCAAMLVEEGYDVVGLFMRTGAHEPADACETEPVRKTKGCCSAVDAGDAQRVADRLDIPFYALNFKEDFDRIKDYFADEYLRGRTPNPCVVCNTWLKFGKLWEYAEAVGAEWIATGHYAQTVRESGRAELHRGSDPTKDQSYFLFGLRRSILERVIFPIGAMEKKDVRAIAERMGLGVAQKPDSQEICFVPTGDYQHFLAEHRPGVVDAPGEVVDVDGKVLGQHGGISRFTIGQRKGLGIALGEPRYVLELAPAENRVVIGPMELLQRSEMEVERTNWLVDPPDHPLEGEVKIRYLHRAAPAVIEPLDDGRAKVMFREKQSAITPGQAAVFYSGSRVLGGGWIC